MYIKFHPLIMTLVANLATQCPVFGSSLGHPGLHFFSFSLSTVYWLTYSTVGNCNVLKILLKPVIWERLFIGCLALIYSYYFSESETMGASPKLKKSSRMWQFPWKKHMIILAYAGQGIQSSETACNCWFVKKADEEAIEEKIRVRSPIVKVHFHSHVILFMLIGLRFVSHLVPLGPVPN